MTLNDDEPDYPPIDTDEVETPWSVHVAGGLGLLSGVAYFLDAMKGDLWYDHPLTLITPIAIAFCSVILWTTPGRRRTGAVVGQYVAAFIGLQFAVALGLPLLIASTVFLFLPTSKPFYSEAETRT